ncbi:MAG: hypothetical protein ABIM40_12155 [Pseudomonadota bacterium]
MLVTVMIRIFGGQPNGLVSHVEDAMTAIKDTEKMFYMEYIFMFLVTCFCFFLCSCSFSKPTCSNLCSDNRVVKTTNVNYAYFSGKLDLLFFKSIQNLNVDDCIRTNVIDPDIIYYLEEYMYSCIRSLMFREKFKTDNDIIYLAEKICNENTEGIYFKTDGVMRRLYVDSAVTDDRTRVVNCLLKKSEYDKNHDISVVDVMIHNDAIITNIDEFKYFFVNFYINKYRFLLSMLQDSSICKSGCDEELYNFIANKIRFAYKIIDKIELEFKNDKFIISIDTNLSADSDSAITILGDEGYMKTIILKL